MKNGRSAKLERSTKIEYLNINFILFDSWA